MPDPTDLWSVFVYLSTKIYQVNVLSRFLLFSAIFSFFLTARCQDSTTALLARLNQAIEASPKYDAAKYRSIQLLKNALAATEKNDLPALFNSYLRLYEEYKVFNYDSGFYLCPSAPVDSYPIRRSHKNNLCPPKAWLLPPVIRHV